MPRDMQVANDGGKQVASNYRHLGPFGDWVEAAQVRRGSYPEALPGPQTRAEVSETLGFAATGQTAPEATVECRWQRDGLAGEVVSWSVGYGPPTRAFVLKPADTEGALPGVLALHGHDGFKYFGKEKIADGPDGPHQSVLGLRASHYEGRAFADDLAREGFLVVAHDAFLWGSRRFPLDAMPPRIRELAAATQDSGPPDQVPHEVPADIALYNAAAWHHEHLIEKYCALLGTTLAGVVSYEDRVAVDYLRSRPDVAGERVGCVGLSGGGCRAALLQATCEPVGAAVVVGMMSTYEELLDHNVADHTWMFLPPGWARQGDWPDLAACRAPSPLLVQYDRDDQLFTPAGMHAAHERITAHYSSTGRPDGYTGQFYDGPHKFDLRMQQAAFAWLHHQLR
jgi:dienelactone hydrolase